MSDGKRQLKIKTGIVTRLKKELAMYEKELAQQKAKVEKMKAEDPTQHSIKQQEQVLAESEVMIPDCRGRLENGFKDLQQALAEFGEQEDVKESEELAAAKALVEEVAPLFQQ